MVIRFVLTLILVSQLQACMPSGTADACKSYEEVCAALKKDRKVNVFVSLKLKAAQPAFETWLSQNDITLVKTFDITNQMLVEITWQRFIALSKHKDVDTIKLDKLHIIEPPDSAL